MADTNMTYSVLGAARSGLAVARLLRSEGARVFVSDSKSDVAEETRDALEAMGASYEFGSHSDRVLDSDVLVLSPGVPDTIPIVSRAREKGMEITNEIEIASRRCRARVVAITGTNGKTTTTELVGHILRTAGVATYVAGNVGTPFSQIVSEADERSVVVLEMSSFQLEHISTFHPAVAILLNITPDHMDRYASFDEYVEAKYRISMNQSAEDTLVYNADDEGVIPLTSRSASRALGFSISREVPTGAFVRDGMLVLNIDTEEQLMRIDEIRIRGPHNLYNAMAAALAARSLGVESEMICEGLRGFSGVPHRLENVREFEGVRYVNDSKATNVNSLWYALSSFDEPIILIAGGKSKKNVYDSILPLLKERVKTAVLIGDAADEMERAFAGYTQIVRCGHDMKAAVESARLLAEPGDVVLLSPACASFDMFNNYEHRGDVFKQLVAELSSYAGASIQ